MLLDLETSFEEIKKLPISEYIVLPINAEIEKFKSKINNLSFPLWIKLNTSEHKLSLGAIKKVNNFEELEIEYKKLAKKFKDSKFIIQENFSGIELILGIKTDKTFGKILLIGSGGSLAESINDTSFMILPINKEEILQALKELKIYKTLSKYPIEKLVSLIEKFISISEDENIKEADLNPVIINESKIFVVDARLELA